MPRLGSAAISPVIACPASNRAPVPSHPEPPGLLREPCPARRCRRGRSPGRRPGRDLGDAAPVPEAARIGARMQGLAAHLDAHAVGRGEPRRVPGSGRWAGRRGRRRARAPGRARSVVAQQGLRRPEQPLAAPPWRAAGPLVARSCWLHGPFPLPRLCDGPRDGDAERGEAVEDGDAGLKLGDLAAAVAGGELLAEQLGAVRLGLGAAAAVVSRQTAPKSAAETLRCAQGLRV